MLWGYCHKLSCFFRILIIVLIISIGSGSIVSAVNITGPTMQYQSGTSNALNDINHSGDGLINIQASGGILSHSDSTIHFINATADSGGTINPSGLVPVTDGENQTFTIVADSCYQISEIYINNLNYLSGEKAHSSPSFYTFTNVTSNQSIRLVFTQLIYSINATASAGGSIEPSGLEPVYCGGNKSYTITPLSGYEIEDVLVDGSSVGAVSSYTFTNVMADHTISASFNQISPETYTIIASAGSGGRIIPNGSVLVTAGENQTFNITNNLGMVIDTVTVDNESQGAIRSYTFYNVSANHTITASFKVLYPTTWYINATAGEGGSIDPSGLVRVFNGYNKSFLVTALSCYDITDVIINNTLNLGSQASPFQYNFTRVTSNQSIEAQFTQKSYTINSTSGKGGEITPSGELLIPCGGSQTFTINPNTYYEVTSVLVDGVEQGILRSYTFSNVTEDHEISAYFTRIPGNYEINATADQYTIIYPNGISGHTEGSNTTYLTQAKPGSDLKSVNVDNTPYLPNETWTFTNITSDHSIMTLGNYTSGQVQVFFNTNQTWGPAPMVVQFTDQSVGDPISFYWQFGDGDVSEIQNPVHLYNSPGIYTITLTASNNLTRWSRRLE